MILQFLLLIVSPSFLFATHFQTNSLKVQNAPDWLKPHDVIKVTERIENRLEWKIKRIPVIWHSSPKTYLKAHSLGPLARAVTVQQGGQVEVHMGPDIKKEDLQVSLAHELVHVIFRQKYRGSIPDWLEEGFANFYSEKDKISKSRLKSISLPGDVTTLTHPFKGMSLGVHDHYLVSQGMVQMLSEKCNLQQLLRLSVEKEITTFVKNSCGIENIHGTFIKWINS